MDKKQYEVGGEQKRGMIETFAPNTLAAYQCVCCDFLPTTEVTIRDLKTNEFHKYTRELDDAGNLIKIFEDGKEI